MSDYLTAEQYEYARKTGDWESGKVLTHGQALTDDQQVVLEWLKQYTLDDSDFKNAICELSKLYIAGVSYKKEEIAFKKLSDSELAQVLAAFAEWGMEQEEE